MQKAGLITVLCFTFLSSIFCEVCPEQKQIVGNETITWKLTSTFSTSDPLCIKDNYEIAIRFCINGVWEEEPTCVSIQRTDSLCPDNLSYVKLREINICYMLMPSVPFDAKCPYSNVFPLYTFYSSISSISTEFVWFPAKGEHDYGIGEYYITEPVMDYGFVLNELIEYEEPLTNQLCLVYNYEVIFKAVACNDSYTKICAYSNFDTSPICEEQYRSQKCIQVEFDTNSHCTCLSMNTTANYGRNDFCNNLIELFHPYQNAMITRNIDTKTCWIGLEKNDNSYIWSDSKSKLNYTYWSANTNFLNKYVAIDKDGWHTKADLSVNCAFCSKPINFSKPSLKLTFDEEKAIFTLEIKNHQSIKELNAEEGIYIYNKAYCFFRPGKTIKYRISEEFNVTVNDNDIIYKFNSNDNYYSGYLWCEAIRYPEIEPIKSNEILVYDKFKHGNKYVVDLTLHYLKQDNLLDQNTYLTYERSIEEALARVFRFKRFAILKTDVLNSQLQILAYAFTIDPKRFNNTYEEYSTLLKLLNEGKFLVKITVKGLLSTDFCNNEVTVVHNKSITWSLTSVGNIALSRELCLQPNGKPIWRNCNEDFKLGASWSEIHGSCNENAIKSNITEELHNLLESDMPLDVILQNLTILSEYFEIFVTIDIYLVARLLRKISSSNSTNLPNATKVVSNLMQINRETLVKSQNVLEATDGILKNYDFILLNSISVEYEPYIFVETKNIIILIVNLNKSNINGIALYYNGTKTVQILDSNTDISIVLQDQNLKAAIVLDKKLIAQIKEMQNSTYQRLIIALFMEDSLFNENKTYHVNIEKVFGILIPEFTENFSAPISMYIKNGIENTLPKTCAHWEFLPSNDTYGRSKWMENSGNMQNIENDNLIACEFWHVTHFGMLVIEKPLNENISEDFLNIVSYINCALSLTGVFIICLTGALFRNWRIEAGHQILLNFSFAIALKIVLLYLSHSLYIKQVEESICITVGAFLHYFVIAEFCWMLVISIFQYRRFVVVFETAPQNIVLKACLIGWITPLIPVAGLLVISPTNYTKSFLEVCYPSGIFLHITVTAPIALILLSNISTFILISMSIFNKNPIHLHKSIYDVYYWWRTIIMLFFLLGLPWVLSFVFYLSNQNIFLYIFNFLSALQGTALFLFFILLNKTTRMLYVNYFRRNFRKYYKN